MHVVARASAPGTVMDQLPRDLAAALCIVQHMAATKTPYLVDILSRSTQLEVRWAEQGEPLDRGKAYVSPPDTHLLFAENHLALSRAARENHARPSINKLFRSAAATHGSRVIAVLLTGMMDDGVAGLRAVREAGGYVIVQDPKTAAFDELPRRAIEAMTPDQTLRLDEVGGALIELAGSSVAAAPIPAALSLEAMLDAGGPATPSALDQLGTQTPISCPDCAGPTWQVGDAHARQFRCYLGHVNSARELLARADQQIETALWYAVRALHDRAVTLETLAADALRLGQDQSAEAYAQRSREAREHSELARRFMFDRLQRS